MSRYREPPLTARDLWDDGPPVKVRDIAAISGLTAETVRADITLGVLIAKKRYEGKNVAYLITREDARDYLIRLGVKPHAA
jgi:hypothetical protein